jgi:biopolymer transport protein ExbD
VTWKIRHQGSPRSIEGLTPGQVVEGLQDGLWETTDEVMGPQDRDWVPIERHPQFEEVAAEIELPPPRVHEDESRLDMNPLIDVCLVLLIFFILTTSYAALQQVLPTPGMSKKDLKGKLEKTKEQIAELMIKVTARLENNKPVIRVEDEVVSLDDLPGALRRFYKATRKHDVVVDADDDIDWGTLIAIQDAVTGAKMDHMHLLERRAEAAPSKK